jgi:hypothetical protein
MNGTIDERVGIAIDGGGAKGFIPLMSLVHLERMLHAPLHRFCDFLIGSSVGAILAAIAATGKLSAEETLTLFARAVPRIFRRKVWPFPMYSRKPFRKMWDEAIGARVKLGEVKVPLVITAVNACTRGGKPDGEPHFFRSDDPHDAELYLRDVVEYSFAAPLYFGGIDDPEHRAVWLDGGTGLDNCPLLEALRQIVLRDWLTGEQCVHLLSLGCGRHIERTPYHKARRSVGKNLREIKLFFSHDDGGLARRQSIDDRVRFLSDIDGPLPMLSFQRVDTELPAKLDKMDAVGYIERYQAIGYDCARTITLAPFIHRLTATEPTF